MGSEAELGPLDVQMYDDDKEDYDSALNAVQSLERLNAYALSAFDQAMFLFLSRTGKKAETVMPLAMQYATSMVRPLVKGDIVIADNLPSHQVAGIAEAIAERGAQFLLLHPIRQTKTPSNKSSPSSKPCYAKPPR